MTFQPIVVLWTLIASGSVAASFYSLRDCLRSQAALPPFRSDQAVDRAVRITAHAALRRELLRLVFDAVFLSVGLAGIVAPMPQAPPSALLGVLRAAFIGAYAVLFAQKVLDIRDGRRVLEVLAEVPR